MKHSRVINTLILIFGILCLLYYFGMGFAVRFGQSAAVPVAAGGACVHRALCDI